MQETLSPELPKPVRFRALGTTAVLVVTDGAARADAAMLLATEVDAIDRACSRFRDDSDLARVNAAAGEWVEVSALFCDTLEVALAAARTTGGVVDPTIERAWQGPGHDRDFAPSATGNWQAVEMDRPARRVRVPRGVELDLVATARALAADRASERIRRATGSGVIVNLGGDCSIAGNAPAGGWTIRVTDRYNAPADAPGATVALFEGGLATSGTTARRWQPVGREPHHVIDPKTGWPTGLVWRSVTVAAPTCVEANRATTAAIALGADARDWLEARRLPARLVAPAGAVVALGGWPARDR